MGYKRPIAPTQFLTGAAATAAYVAIGMRFAAEPSSQDPNIEDTLLAASLEGAAGDLRALAMLTDWLEVHAGRVNVDRLMRLAVGQGSSHVLAYWSAIAKWQKKDSRFKKLEHLYTGSQVDLLNAGTRFAISRHGEDERFAGALLRVPNGALRRRPADISTPSEVAQRHATYRWRTLMGPSYRADMWAALERDPKLSAAALARCTYGSFATAWQVKLDWKILHADQAA